MDALTEEVLRKLYLEEKLTDGEIASRFGQNQVYVSRLRKRYGIPTMLKSDRLGLPPLTLEQREVVIGSLLGDGSLVRVGESTARFSEMHGEKQEEYLRWKAGLLAPFTSSVFPVEKVVEERVYQGLTLITHASREFFPLWDAFYSGGSKVFPEELPEILSPRGLAIWYLDDGGVVKGSSPRITFGLGERSLRRAISALRKLGFKSSVSDSGDGEITILFPGQADTFYNLVKPYVPSCMSFKMPQDSPRREVDRNARVLTPKRASILASGGMTISGIASTFSVGVSTVRRRLQQEGVAPLPRGRPRTSYTLLAAEVALGQYSPKEWEILGESEKARWLKGIFGVLRKSPFPTEEEPSQEEALETLAQVVKVPMHLEGGVIVPRSVAGTTICKGFFPNRYRATSKHRMSAFEAWHDDRKLKAAIKFQLDRGDPVIPRRVLWAVCLEQRTPSIFRPTVARFLYETYCPSGGRVWDPCAGYGGRLLGALAAGVRYLGTDVDGETVRGNQRLAELLGRGVEVLEALAETFAPPSVDMVFTSPPYFDRERYSGHPDQSWVKHGEGFDVWVSGFLTPLLRTAYQALPSGGRAVLNVSDLKEKGALVPIVRRTEEAALREGFVLEARLEMPLAAVNRKKPSEPVLVFQKP